MMIILNNDKFTALLHQLGVFDKLTVNLIKDRLDIAGVGLELIKGLNGELRDRQ